MQYRIKYVYKSSRDKGYEIMDCYGPYRIYAMQQEQCELQGDTSEKRKAPRFPKDEYIAQANSTSVQKNKKIRSQRPQEQKEDNPELFDMEKYHIIGAGWVEKEGESSLSDAEVDGVEQYLIGTEMANFLNFDIDRFMYGGHRLRWEYDEEFEMDKLVGWEKTPGHNLDDMSVRVEVSLAMVHGGGGDHLTEDIPFFIRMFGCKFIDTENWCYNMEEVEAIKVLQDRLRVFCEKVFFPSDSEDKRTNLERYCDNIAPLEKKELRKKIPKDWFTTDNLEQALAVECYAMIKGNVNFFRCSNCGLYTVANDNRARLCTRLIYDGNRFNEETKYFENYYYQCNKEQYNRVSRDNMTGNLISSITLHERKRLYNHISGHNRKLWDIQNELIMEFDKVVRKHEYQYISKVEQTDDSKEILEYANEYLQIIIDRMNETIKALLKSGAREEYLFTRKKNKAVVATTGKIYG